MTEHLFEISYDNEFKELITNLRNKYPKELFELEGIGSQLDISKFSRQFFSKNTTAEASVDENANVSSNCITTYKKEVVKPLFKLNSLFILWKTLRKSYNTGVANDIIEKQIRGDIYINDLWMVQNFYCYNYSCLDIINKGLPMIDNIESKPPKYLMAFKEQLTQFVAVACNSSTGATGLADILLCASYYVKNILKTGKDGHFSLSSEDDVWSYVKETLISLIYTLNQRLRSDQCYSEDTEILTPSGFKKYNELNVNDDIYTYKDGKMNINKVQKVNIYDFDGEMHQYKGRDIDQLVSPNHRVVYVKNNSKDIEVKQSFELIDAKTPLNIPVALENTREDYDISDELLEIISIILTDGTVKKGVDGRRDSIEIYKSPKRFGNDLIIDLLNRLNLKYTIGTKTSGFGEEYYINVYRISADSSESILKLINHSKKILPQWLFLLSQRQARIFIDRWASMDGHVRSNSNMRLQCDNSLIQDQIQHIAFLAGLGSRKHSRLTKNNKKETIYVTTYTRKTKYASEKNKVYYKGKIWCPTTEDGIVIARRDGKIFISGNSPFTNVSIYDENFLKESQKTYVFPDGTNPDIEIVKKLQELFLDIINEELGRTVFTYPVMTACFSTDDDNNILDENFLQMISEKNQKYGFINMYIGKTSTLSSCCRLRSDKNNEYFNSIGGSTSSIGSLGVVTINLPRIAFTSKSEEEFFDKLEELAIITGKINNSKRKIIQQKIDEKKYPLYTHEFVDLKKQYSTLGINGMYEAMYELGYDITTEKGMTFAKKMCNVLNNIVDNMEKKYKAPHNMEQTPSESSSPKMCSKDKVLGIQDKYVLYSNQFIPLTATANLLDRISIQGKLDNEFSGGSILHLNVDKQVDIDKLKKLIKHSAKKNVVYFAVNYQLNKCNNNHMTVGKTDVCTECGEPITDKYSRVVGFLVNVKNMGVVRRDNEYSDRKFYESIGVQE